MISQFTHNGVTCIHRTGTEGPHYDPYHFDEVIVTLPRGDTVEIHSGLLDWVRRNGITIDQHDPEQCHTSFKNLTGKCMEEWITWEQDVREQEFVNSLTNLEKTLIHLNHFEQMAEAFTAFQNEQEYPSYSLGENWPDTAWMVTTMESARHGRCDKGDHVLVSDDYGSPDSGYMGHHCAVCGESWGGYIY